MQEVLEVPNEVAAELAGIGDGVLGTLAAQAAPAEWTGAARAIMTTDTFPKGAHAVAEIDGPRAALGLAAPQSAQPAPSISAVPSTTSAIRTPRMDRWPNS